MARSSVAPSVLPAAWPQLCFLRHNAHVARIAAALFVIVLGVAAGAAQTPASRTVILSTTTSTQDSGLLDVLVPIFERQTGLTVKTASVGTGQALALAARGEADVVLVHAPSLEQKHVEEGKLHDRRAYPWTVRGTYLAFSKRAALKPLVEGDTALFNVYSVMEVNPASGPRVNAAGGKAFADFMLAPATQAVIKAFGIEKFGQPLFVPIAGKKDEDL